ncbi:MAG: BadF/BadG/BcrA/BcrD ATPase family protein [Acidobacteriia bacterium]|nr:BadF/BadG/BcrA/BcrD ATPase family protein [Terriglobia bacterium]
MILTAGIDVGASSVKIAVLEYGTKNAGSPHRAIYLAGERFHKRDPKLVIRGCFESALRACDLSEDDFAYIASTGEGDLISFRRGHFYGMTTHARGAQFLFPSTRSVLDIGALHARAMRVDERSKVLQYQMTGQCASGSGQFLENIARYLGVGLEEVGPLSMRARRPEIVSGICAVLAETDVINMVSRGVETADILRGIHESIGGRLVRLLRAIKAESPVTITGGLARDTGLMAVLREKLSSEGTPLEIQTHDHSALAGALGAALWAGFRHERLAA